MKITTWNAEWLDTHWGTLTGKYAPGQAIFPHKAPSKAMARKRISATQSFIDALEADVLFICEAVKGEAEMLEFANKVAPEHDLIVRQPGDGYETKGRQWQWFLVRKSLSDRIVPSLVPIDTWRKFASRQDRSIGPDGTWKVSVPKLKKIGDIDDVPVATRTDHDFHREPQILRFSFGGSDHEVIGAHLKSKFVGRSPRARRSDETLDDYLKSSKSVRMYIAKSHEARVKLSSEALMIRAYIDQRFEQDADPSILVVGDLNDGPGKELMEREYLLHDLISNLQGEVFFAKRFLNHALFDQPDHLRWTCTFKDRLDPGRNQRILLDHILFTQALTRSGTSPLLAESRSGRVEHLLLEQTESRFGQGLLSDHRPVSLNLVSRRT